MEFSLDGFGDKPLRRGPTMLLLDAFTDNERWVAEDSEEGQAWLAAHPPGGRTLTVVNVDRDARLAKEIRRFLSLAASNERVVEL